MNGDLTIGLLSWKAHVTLERTLASYEAARLASTAARSFVFFNAETESDRELAGRFGWEAKGAPENLRIWGGMDAIAAEAETEYVMFLQNDCPAIVPADEAARWIDGAMDLLRRGEADMAHLRHRIHRGQTSGHRRFFSFFPLRRPDPRVVELEAEHLPEGYGEDTLCRRLHRALRPFAARRQMNSFVYLGASPELDVPRWVRREGDFFIVDSAILNFTEQPFVVSKRLYLELSDWARRHSSCRKINGAPVMEHALNCRWWRSRHFRIAVCDGGVFTHNRFDDSFRPSHRAYNAAIAEGGAG